MVLGLFLRISWTCLLLFSSGACLPFTKDHYVYPYKLDWLHFGSPAKDQQTGNAPQQPSSPTEIQSSSSPEAHRVEAERRQSHHPNRWTVTYDIRSDKSSSASHVLSQSAGYTGSAVSSGNTDVGSHEAGSSPVTEHVLVSPTSYSAHTVWYTVPYFRYSDGHGLDSHNPAASGSGYTPFYTSPLAASGVVHEPAHPQAAAATWLVYRPAYHKSPGAPEFGYKPTQYYNALVASGLWVGPHETYASAPIIPRPGHRLSPAAWWFWDGPYRDNAPAAPRFGSTAGSPSGDEQPADEAEPWAYSFPGFSHSERPQSEAAPLSSSHITALGRTFHPEFPQHFFPYSSDEAPNSLPPSEEGKV